jgi:hypothetical protein
MPVSWYSIELSLQSVAIFNGYFSVDNDLVTAFYETIGGSTDFSNSILGPANNPWEEADNIFFQSTLAFSDDGVNITSTLLQNEFDSPTPYYNLYNSYVLYYQNTSGGDYENVNARIILIDDPSCFNEGTKILCLKNLKEYIIPIENLRKGDLVKSYKHGYRKIDLIGKNPMINNPEKFNECMYKMEKTQENGLLEDLIVTGGHAILVDELGSYKEENDLLFGGKTPTIDDKYLLLSTVSKEFIKLDNTNLYTYYHFTLENNGNDDERFGVWANGILTETPSKNQFINHKYTLL